MENVARRTFATQLGAAAGEIAKRKSNYLNGAWQREEGSRGGSGNY